MMRPSLFAHRNRFADDATHHSAIGILATRSCSLHITEICFCISGILGATHINCDDISTRNELRSK